MENNLDSKFSLQNILILTSYQACCAIVFGFGIYMLLQRGFSSSIAGVVFAVSYILGLLLQPILADYLDKSTKISIFDIIIILAIIMIIAFIAYFFVSNGSIFILIIFVFSTTAVSVLEPLLNSISSVLKVNNINVVFSTARACGSFVYGITSMLFGVLTNKFSYFAVIVGGLVVSIIFTVFSFIFNSNYKKVKTNRVLLNEDNDIPFDEFIKNNIKFLLLCFALVGIFFGYMAGDNFIYLIIDNIHGNSEDMGIVLGVKAILEGIVMVNFSKLSKRFKLNTLLSIAVTAFTLKSLCYYLAKTTFLVYACQTIQMISFALLLPGMIEYIDLHMNSKVAIRGNSLFTMTITAGAIIASLLGGYLSDNYGIRTLCLVAFIVTLISNILFILILNLKKD